MNEIIFEVRDDEVDGGFVATALGHAIATQGETVEELREMVWDAVRCHFGDSAPGPMPRIIRFLKRRRELEPGTGTSQTTGKLATIHP